MALFQSGNLEAAERASRELLPRLPGNPDLRHMMALVSLNLGRPDEALARIDALASELPGDMYVHNTRGAILQSLGRIEDSVVAYRRAHELDPAYLDSAGNLAMALHLAGRAQEAFQFCRDIAARSPRFLPVQMVGGYSGLAIGRLPEAQSFFAQALDLAPGNAEALQGRGMVLRRLGRHAEAVRELEAAEAAAPGNLEWRVEYAAALVDAGNPARAEAVCHAILEGAPGHPGATAMLGTLHHNSGRFEDALRAYDAAIEGRPRDAAVHTNRGVALLALKRASDAESALRTAAGIDPGYAPAWHNLGCALLEQGRHEACESAERKALAIDPGFGDATINLALTLNETGRAAEAEPLLRALLKREPSRVEALVNLAGSLTNLQRHEQAGETLLEVVRLSPGDANAHGLAGNLFAQIGRHDQSVALYDAAIGLAPDQVHWQVLRALAMPAIPNSMAEIVALREDMARRIAGLSAGATRLVDPERHIGATGFYLAYHGADNVALQRAIAAMYLKLQPTLGWINPQALPQDRAGRRLRVGFLSAFLQSHTIGKLYRGLVREIDRSRFEVVVFHTDARQDAIVAEIDDAADAVVVLPRRLEEARLAIAEARLDILFYPDIGMSPFCYFLALARLAPVQVTSWGHPDTTGLPNIDHYISAEAIEPEGAAPRYSEKLERLTRLPACYKRPQRAAALAIRERYQLPPGAKVYACPQSLFKFHPDFDRTLGALLAADPNARLVLVAGMHTAWCADLLARFRRAFPDQVDRVHTVHSMPENEFHELLLDADAVLDPSHFGGGNSTYEAFGLGVPVVTMPGPFMRGRVTLGCYRQMGFEDLVAAGPEEYVALAVRLANDTAFRSDMRAKVRERSAALFDDAGAVRELEALFERTYDEALARARPA